MAKITVKALVDGQEKDVELDDEKLPNGLLSQSQHDARMSTEARSQFARGERAGIKKAVEDDATRTTVIDQLRSGGHLESDDDEGDGGDGKKSKRKPSPEEVEAIRGRPEARARAAQGGARGSETGDRSQPADPAPLRAHHRRAPGRRR